MTAAKICGLTDPADARHAAACGAAWLGVVFASGPRVVDAAQAAVVVRAAGAVPVLGVFGTQPVDAVLATCAAAGLAGAQLHGRSTAADAHRLRAAGLVVWRVARVDSVAAAGAVADLAEGADAVLVEPHVPGREGGTGVALRLEVARAARAALAGVPMVLAGGLTPATVAAAVAAVQPEVADVSSGVEVTPGRKDPARVRAFVEAVSGHLARS